MNFSAMELSVLIHVLKQQLRPIRRVNRSGMRTNDHFLHSNSEMNRTNSDEELTSGESRNLDSNPKTFYNFWLAVSGKLRACQTPDGHSRTGWRPCSSGTYPTCFIGLDIHVGNPYISMHNHSYPSKIYIDIHPLYPKSYPCIIHNVIHQGIQCYPYISFLHFAYQCISK
jgi:hypothetical protein